MTTTYDVVAQFKTAVAGKRSVRLGLAALLVVAIVGGIVLVRGCTAHLYHRTATAYFSNTSGMFVGDQVRILGVPVGKITKIDPEPLLAKLKERKQRHDVEVRHFQKIETWRDRLLNEPDAVDQLLEENPAADRAELMGLVAKSEKERMEQRPPSAARELFAFLRRLLG